MSFVFWLIIGAAILCAAVVYVKAKKRRETDISLPYRKEFCKRINYPPKNREKEPLQEIRKIIRY